MRKKESWMKKGANVSALGEHGTIHKMQENTLNGIDYVYYIWVKINGKVEGPYHPNDINTLNKE
jgi:hypothetical protein